MSTQNLTTEDPQVKTLKRAARRQAIKSMGWKLAFVAVALIAYAGQKGLEGTKKSYDAERSKPFVIVDDAGVGSADQLPKGDFIALRASRLKAPLSAADHPPKNSSAAPQHLPLDEFVNRIEYQNFRDEKEIIDRLYEEVLAENDLTKRAYLDSRDALNKHRAEKLTTLADEKSLVYGRLNQVVSDEMAQPDEAGKAKSVVSQIDELLKEHPADEAAVAELKGPPPGKTPNSGRGKRRGAARTQPPAAPDIRQALAAADKVQLAVWLNTVNRQINDEQNVEVARQWIADADRDAQRQIKSIHEALRPQLPEIVSAAKKEQRILQPAGAVFSFLDPRSIFNDKSGSYVIYQTLWVICLGVLVFFVVFIVFTLLRPLPFFASKSEVLMKQLEKLFSGPGGGEGSTPQIARSLIVTVAALGIGTAAAVAVAGDRIVSRTPPGGGTSYPIATATPDDEQPSPPRPPRVGYPPASPFRVELSPEIIYPQPTVIEHISSAAPFDPTIVSNLHNRITDLATSNAALLAETNSLRKEIAGVGQFQTSLNSLQKQLGTVDVPTLQSQVALVGQGTVNNKTDINNLSEKVGQLQTDFGNTLKGIATDLTTTKGAVSDLRNNSFERSQNSGGRGFFTRTRQFLNGDRFMVTNQGYGALNDLMCRGGCEGEKAAILAVLKSLIGSEPTDEKTFLSKFSAINADALKRWKPLLLKYARIPY
jgi:hypothetical protein